MTVAQFTTDAAPGQAIEMVAATRLAEYADFSAVGPDDVHQDPDERALAGAVRSKQAEDLAVGHIERDVIERSRLAVPFREVIE